MSYSKFVVPYCDYVRYKEEECRPYSRFPKDLERCRIWIRAVGIEDLVYLLHQKLNTMRFVCACHFDDAQFTNATRKRLKLTAVPTLFDPRVVPLADTIVDAFAAEPEQSISSIILIDDRDMVAKGLPSENRNSAKEDSEADDETGLRQSHEPSTSKKRLRSSGKVRLRRFGTCRRDNRATTEYGHSEYKL